MKVIQKVGDRDKEQWSIKDIAFTIPANPMSDRIQLIITNETDDLRLLQQTISQGDNRDIDHDVRD